MFRPKLKLELRSKHGDLTEANLVSPEHPDGRLVPARYYHLLVSNSSQVTKATQVQVYLTRVEMPGPDGKIQIRWDSEIPLRWSHQEINPLMRTIGPTAWCDIFNIVQDKWLELDPVILPYSLKPYWRHPPKQKCHLVLSVQARSAEGTSPIARFEIIWNGDWHDGKEEMAKNVIINRLLDN